MCMQGEIINRIWQFLRLIVWYLNFFIFVILTVVFASGPPLLAKLCNISLSLLAIIFVF
jgi:hypothetical protein